MPARAGSFIDLKLKPWMRPGVSDPDQPEHPSEAQISMGMLGMGRTRSRHCIIENLSDNSRASPSLDQVAGRPLGGQSSHQSQPVMSDRDCVAFLQWALPQMHLRWAGFRRVRRQVCRRLRRRAHALGVRDLSEYRRYVERTPREWSEVDAACRITISRFYRDHRVFERLVEVVLPRLATEAVDDGSRHVRCLSLGCASGEEPYTLAILWRMELASRYPGLGLRTDALDVDERLLERAIRGCYAQGTLRELPERWRLAAFEPQASQWCVKEEFRRGIRFERRDVRGELPQRQYDLVLCRNLVLTYYASALQIEILARIAERMRPGSALVVGAHEAVPGECDAFVPWPNAPNTYCRVGDAAI